MKKSNTINKEESYSRSLPNDGIEEIEIEPVAMEDM